MRLLTCYFKKYGPVYGLLVIMSYLFITALSVLVLLVSMHSVLIVIALGFIALLIVQFVVQSNEVNVALGSFGLLVSIVALILSILSLSTTSMLQIRKYHGWNRFFSSCSLVLLLAL